jgi:hypothetical protein
MQQEYKRGLPIIFSHESVYLESGWERLAERHRLAILKSISDIHNYSVPAYLKKKMY